ncbi:hypothetical protein BH09BAC4_BH09BAC4_04820 [soil metagenome]
MAILHHAVARLSLYFCIVHSLHTLLLAKRHSSVGWLWYANALNSQQMATSNFTTTFVVDQSPQEVFNAINNIRGWWTEDMDGDSQKLNDEFTVRFADVHVSTQQVVELIPAQKLVWLVTNSQLNFIQDKQEWMNTSIAFDIRTQDNQTQIHFTHVGLVPQIDCFDTCSTAWSRYIQGSLFKLITEGKGRPGL